MSTTTSGTAAPTAEATVVRCKNGRTYSVVSSAFGGHSVVEVLASGLRRPVRNLRERDAAIAAATGAQGGTR